MSLLKAAVRQMEATLTEGPNQRTGKKSILREPLRSPELTTCQLSALRLCVLPHLGGRNEALVGLLSTAFARGNSGK